MARSGSTTTLVDPDLGVQVIDDTGLDIEASSVWDSVRHQPEVAAMVRWVTDILPANEGGGRGGRQTRAGTLFRRDRYLDPGTVFEQMMVARDATESDDIVGGVADTTEALAFNRMSFLCKDEDEEDVWNQLAGDLDLDSRLREMWRELFTFSQFYSCIWWGHKTYKVRGETESGNAKRKTFENLEVPLGLTILDPLKVVPVGGLLFNQESLAYLADPFEVDMLDAAAANDPQADPLARQIILEHYEPSELERRQLANAGISIIRLYRLNPANVFRHTLTRPQYQRFAAVRMRSVFEILDLKAQLRQMDRAHLVGGTNFIVLVKKGSDQFPAKPSEVTNLQAQVRTVAQVPVIVGDHRLSVEIVTPKTDKTLEPERYNGLNAALTARLYGMFNTGNFCLTVDTQIFTRFGWVTFDQLRVGDEVLTANPSTGMSEWQATTAVNVFDHDGPIFSMEAASHSSLSTAEHRWLVSQRFVPGEYRWEFRQAHDLTAASKIPVALPCADLPTAATVPDDLVELLAWFWTEGNFAHGGTMWSVNQSPTANPRNCARIEALFRRLFGEPSPPEPRDEVTGRFAGGTSWRRWGKMGFTAPTALFDMRRFVSAEKIPTQAFLHALTAYQLTLFINIAVDGDGCRGGNKECLFQKDPEGIVFFQQLCVLAGLPVSTVRHTDLVDRVTLLKRQFIRPIAAADVKRGPAQARAEWVHYKGQVWCPTTPNGTWLAKRRGTIYFTGNSAGAKNDDSIKLAMVVARGMEGRRRQLKRVIEAKVISETWRRNAALTRDTKLRFHPSRIELTFDPSTVQFLIDMRDRGDISRESYVGELDVDQADEAVLREREKDRYDDIFTPTIVPFTGPVTTTDKPKPDPRTAGRNQGGNKNGGGAAPGTGQGKAPRRGVPKDKPKRPGRVAATETETEPETETEEGEPE